MHIFFYLVTIAALLFLGVFVYFNNTKSKINRFFSLFSLLVLFWTIFVFLSDFLRVYDFALFFTQLAIIPPAFMAPTFFVFASYFPRIKNTFSLKKKILIYSPAILISIFTLTKYNVASITFRDTWTDFEPGMLYYFLFAEFAIYMFAGFFTLYKKIKNSVGREKLQIIYLWVGTIISIIIGISTNLILPLFSLSNSSVYGPLFTLFFISFTAYAIIRYRLMDIRVIIRRSAVFTVLVSLITAIYALIAYVITLFFQDLIGAQSVILNGIITAIFVAIGFEPLKKGLSQITNTFLFKAEYNPQDVLTEYSDKLSSTLNLDELNRFLVKKTGEVFKAEKVSFCLFNQQAKEYQEVAFIGKKSAVEQTRIEPTLFDKVFTYLKKMGRERDIIVREEVKKLNELLPNPVLTLLAKQLDEQEINLIVPFYAKEELIGILFLGDKKSGDVYSQQDLNVLGIIAGQAAVAIQNAGLYEEQKHFAEYLKEEVDKATKELKVANVQLKKLDKAKSEFISIASHQLRTPLTIIKGYLSMIHQKDFGEVPEKLANPLDKTYKSTERIIGLVEDLLNVSRIESGRMKYDFAKNDLNEIATEVFEELEQHAKNKGLTFTYDKPKEKLPELMLDRAKIREVVMNLMDNAIKYTDSGFVKIKLEKLNHNVRFSVTDSGRGLEADEIPLLFQKFSRAKGAQLMHTEGTGLGLYIAKNILKKHQAKIWVESPGKDKGSTFIIEFKVK